MNMPKNTVPKARSWKAKMDGFAAHLLNLSYVSDFQTLRLTCRCRCPSFFWGNLVHHVVRTSETVGCFFLDVSSQPAQ